jgi:hypothetical protein
VDDVANLREQISIGCAYRSLSIHNPIEHLWGASPQSHRSRSDRHWSCRLPMTARRHVEVELTLEHILSRLHRLRRQETDEA